MEDKFFFDTQKQKMDYNVFFTEPTSRQATELDESKNKIEINETIQNAENTIYRIVKANLFSGYKDISKFKDSMFKTSNSKQIKNKNINIHHNKKFMIKDNKNESPLTKFNINHRNKLRRFRSLIGSNSNLGNKDNKVVKKKEKKEKIMVGSSSNKFQKTKKGINFRNFATLSVDNKKSFKEKALTFAKKQGNTIYDLYATRENLKKIYRDCIKDIKDFKYLNTSNADNRTARLDSSFEKLMNPKKDEIIQKDIIELQPYSNIDEIKKSRLKDILFTKSKNDAISNLSENFAYNVNKPLLKIFSTDFEENRTTRKKIFNVKDNTIISKLEDDNRNKKLLVKRLEDDFYKYNNNGYYIINKTGEKFQNNKIILGGMLRNKDLPIIQNNSYFASLYNNSYDRMNTNSNGNDQ